MSQIWNPSSPARPGAFVRHRPVVVLPNCLSLSVWIVGGGEVISSGHNLTTADALSNSSFRDDTRGGEVVSLSVL